MSASRQARELLDAGTETVREWRALQDENRALQGRHAEAVKTAKEFGQQLRACKKKRAEAQAMLSKCEASMTRLSKEKSAVAKQLYELRAEHARLLERAGARVPRERLVRRWQ